MYFRSFRAAKSVDTLRKNLFQRRQVCEHGESASRVSDHPGVRLSLRDSDSFIEESSEEMPDQIVVYLCLQGPGPVFLSKGSHWIGPSGAARRDESGSNRYDDNEASCRDEGHRVIRFYAEEQSGNQAPGGYGNGQSGRRPDHHEH